MAVIPLIQVTHSAISSGYQFFGSIIFGRGNSPSHHSSLFTIRVNDPAGAYYAGFNIGRKQNTNSLDILPCVFKYNNTWYAGLKVVVVNSAINISIQGQFNSSLLNTDFYAHVIQYATHTERTVTSIDNQEIYDSIDTTNLEIEDLNLHTLCNDRQKVYTSTVTFGADTGGTGWYRIASLTNARNGAAGFKCNFNFSHGYSYNKTQRICGTISYGYGYELPQILITENTGGSGFVGFRLSYRVDDNSIHDIYIDGLINCLNYNVAGRDAYYLSFTIDYPNPLNNSTFYFINSFYSKTNDLINNENLIVERNFLDNLLIGSTEVFRLERGVSALTNGQGVQADYFKSFSFYSQTNLRLLIGSTKPSIHFSGFIIYRRGIYSLIVVGSAVANSNGVYRIDTFKCDQLSCVAPNEPINAQLAQDGYYLQLDIMTTYSHTIIFGSFSETNISRHLKIFTSEPS